MTEPIKLGCHCGFVSDDPQAFIDHCLATQHIELGAGEDDGSIDEMLRMFAAVQHAAANPAAPLPGNATMRQVSVEDILTDDDLSDDEKHVILARLEDLKRRKG